jgi:glycosyltransferase involved in cell wall biosynthesis
LAAAADFQPTAAASDEGIAEALELPRRYLLYVGTIQPRKNVEMLVAAFAQMRRADVPLLIAGRVRPGYRPGFLDAPPAGVRCLGAVSDAQLAVLYRRAAALVSPSSYEGFGLSLLEAMSSGCLVISGNNSAIPELVGDCGLLLDELTVESLRQVMQRVVGGDPSLEAMRAAALQRAARYSWEETARRTLAVYREVMGGR